jgi:hypothetical protein
MEQAHKLLQAALTNVQPFTITLEKFNFIQHTTWCTLYLEPKITPPKALDNLLTEVLKVFPQCDDWLKKNKEQIFLPHISIGRFRTKDECLKERKRLQTNWEPIKFPMKEIYIMYRVGNDPFEARHVVHLGKNPTKAFYGLDTADEDSVTAKTIVVCGFPKSKITTDSELMDFAKQAGIKAQKAEVILNPDKKPRTIGVLELSSKQECVDTIESYNYQPFEGHTVYLKRLEVMLYPDVVGGCCTIKE